MAPIFHEFTGDGIGTHGARWRLFRTSGESVEGLPCLSTAVSEIYGSRRRLPSLLSFLIESRGQLFGFHIGGGAWFRDMTPVNIARKLELLLPSLITQLDGTVGGIASLDTEVEKRERERRIAEYRE